MLACYFKWSRVCWRVGCYFNESRFEKSRWMTLLKRWWLVAMWHIRWNVLGQFFQVAFWLVFSVGQPYYAVARKTVGNWLATFPVVEGCQSWYWRHANVRRALSRQFGFGVNLVVLYTRKFVLAVVGLLWLGARFLKWVSRWVVSRLPWEVWRVFFIGYWSQETLGDLWVKWGPSQFRTVVLSIWWIPRFVVKIQEAHTKWRLEAKGWQPLWLERGIDLVMVQYWFQRLYYWSCARVLETKELLEDPRLRREAGLRAKRAVISRLNLRSSLLQDGAAGQAREPQTYYWFNKDKIWRWRGYQTHWSVGGDASRRYSSSGGYGNPWEDKVWFKRSIWHLVTPSPLPYLLGLITFNFILTFYGLTFWSSQFGAFTFELFKDFELEETPWYHPLEGVKRDVCLWYKGMEVELTGWSLEVQDVVVSAYCYSLIGLWCLVFGFWHWEVYLEGSVERLHNWQINRGFLLGWGAFIGSEAAIFATLFGSYFSQALLSNVFTKECDAFQYMVDWQAIWAVVGNRPLFLDGVAFQAPADVLSFFEEWLLFWDITVVTSSGIQAIEPFGLPILNTLILVISGMAMTRALALCNIAASFSQQWAYLFINWTLFWVVGLGVLFVGCQYFEYKYGINFSIKDSVFSSYFFLITGLHGLHVLMGALFIIMAGFWFQFKFITWVLFQYTTPKNFEAVLMASWYWHFVDGIWIFVWLCLYQSPATVMDQAIEFTLDFLCGRGGVALLGKAVSFVLSPLLAWWGWKLKGFDAVEWESFDDPHWNHVGNSELGYAEEVESEWLGDDEVRTLEDVELESLRDNNAIGLGDVESEFLGEDRPPSRDEVKTSMVGDDRLERPYGAFGLLHLYI